MASHPYISGAGNIAQMVGQLRKNFPSIVTSETVKKLGLASNNESYVINALQFIGILDEEGKRTDKGQKTLAIHKEEEFRTEFSKLVESAYSELFELRGKDAWTLSKDELINFFRTSDKTSDAIGQRQAAVFRVFATLAGYVDQSEVASMQKKSSAPKQTRDKTKKQTAKQATEHKASSPKFTDPENSKRDVGLTVRVEINLPAGGTQETYDSIFKSIKANLIDS
jgi:hypothetical protein